MVHATKDAVFTYVFIHFFTHSFLLKYLMSTYNVPDSVLDAGVRTIHIRSLTLMEFRERHSKQIIMQNINYNLRGKLIFFLAFWITLHHQ